MAALLAVEPPLDAISLLSQDTRIDPGWCARATAAFGEDPHAGIIGAKVRLPNGVTVRHAGGAVERPRFVARHAGHHDPGLAAFDAPREVDFVAGASMAMRTSALRTVGLFDSVFSPGSYEDVDLCARCRAASWSVRYVPDLAATHFETASFAERRARLRITHRNRFIYALGHLTDPAAREALFSSEIEHVRRTDDLDERHAIATACLSVMLGLPDILAARVPQHAPDVALQRDLIDIFTQLRTAALAASSGNP
jgi:GT2 family glycosyltransferase